MTNEQLDQAEYRRGYRIGWDAGWEMDFYDAPYRLDRGSYSYMQGQADGYEAYCDQMPKGGSPR
jgi:hypothetical protein